ncbi:chalcone isomerase family protein [Aliivibrio kagoshimensis]|uniref:chalcone isomerase family protein n=1 Tax=Aliivibrio kagoshimensis TaxID=2910230 RepID=UPI003D0C0656
MKNLTVIMLCCWLALPLSALSTTLNGPLSTLKKSGQGTMNFMFWSVYKAELYGPDVLYLPNRYPKALNITYYQNITSEALIDATYEQWMHLKYDEKIITSWLKTLRLIWPDIKKDEQILLVVNGEGMSHFYHQGEPIGQINDQRFGDAFLSIWLSESTSRPKLRKKLMGFIKSDE